MHCAFGAFIVSFFAFCLQTCNFGAKFTVQKMMFEKKMCMFEKIHMKKCLPVVFLRLHLQYTIHMPILFRHVHNVRSTSPANFFFRISCAPKSLVRMTLMVKRVFFSEFRNAAFHLQVQTIVRVLGLFVVYSLVFTNSVLLSFPLSLRCMFVCVSCSLCSQFDNFVDSERFDPVELLIFVKFLGIRFVV